MQANTDGLMRWANRYLAYLKENPGPYNVNRLYLAATDMLALLRPEDVAKVFPEYAELSQE